MPNYVNVCPHQNLRFAFKIKASFLCRATPNREKKKHDLTSWKYAELRDTINTSCGEFHNPVFPSEYVGNSV